jgi:hypothetical protein
MFSFSSAGEELLSDLLVTVFLGAIWNVLRDTPRRIVVGSLFALPILLLTWIDHHYPSPSMELLWRVLLVILELYTIKVMLTDVLSDSRVTGDHLLGAAAVYFLFGFVTAELFTILETVYPGSFSPLIAPAVRNSTLLYFSFTNLTTVGFGDIVPVHPLVRNVAVLEGVAGQFYLTVLVARMVGLHVATREAP